MKGLMVFPGRDLSRGSTAYGVVVQYGIDSATDHVLGNNKPDPLVPVTLRFEH